MPESKKNISYSTITGLLFLDQKGIITETGSANTFHKSFNKMPGKPAADILFPGSEINFTAYLEKLKQNLQLAEPFTLQLPGEKKAAVTVLGFYFPKTNSFQLTILQAGHQAEPNPETRQPLPEGESIEQLKAKISELQNRIQIQQAALETTNDIIFIKDTEGKYILVNKAFLVLAKKQEHEVYGKTDFEFFPPDIAKKIVQDDQEAMLKKEPLLFEESLLIDGVQYLFLTSKASIQDESGKVIGMAGIARDISELKEAEENLLAFQQEQELLNMHLRTQEEERGRTAEALHNTIGQIFYALKYNLQNLPSDAPEVQTVRNTLNTLVLEGIQQTKTISYELRPTLLENFGIFKSIQQLAEKHSNKDLQVSCSFNCIKKRLSANTELAIYRIIQEFLNNIVRHSKASKATIDVNCLADNMHINITDNGKGFDYNHALESATCSGLKTIAKRIQLLNAQFNLQSEKDKGTRIRISLKI